MKNRRVIMWATLCALIFLSAPQGHAHARQTGAAAAELNVRGRLGTTVEPGGWLIVSGREKWLLLNAAQWRNESWFRAGTEVLATGTPRPGTITTQQEGTPFEARTLRPAAAADDHGQPAAMHGDTMGLTRVTVSGEATIQAQPDTAVVTVAVTTQGRTALEAQQENARKSDAVVRAVKAAAGAGAEVKTSGYSLQPQYAYREGQPPTIRAYDARNSVTITLTDLTRVGAVIDAAANAGATNVDALSFTLRQDRPARDTALAAATQEALNKARVIAQALGGRVTRIIEVQEAGTARPPVPLYAEARMAVSARADAPPTPVEVGALDIRSQVQLIAEITTGQ